MDFKNFSRPAFLIGSVLFFSNSPSWNAQTFSFIGSAHASETDGALDIEEMKFVSLINSFRKENGLEPLQISRRLNAVAQWMVNDMVQMNNISHTDSLGRDPYERMESLGYRNSRASGENLCAGTVSSTAERAFQQWKDSPGHRENMLGPRFRFMGIARAYGEQTEYGWYWANEFGSSDN